MTEHSEDWEKQDPIPDGNVVAAKFSYILCLFSHHAHISEIIKSIELKENVKRKTVGRSNSSMMGASAAILLTVLSLRWLFA